MQDHLVEPQRALLIDLASRRQTAALHPFGTKVEGSLTFHAPAQGLRSFAVLERTLLLRRSDPLPWSDSDAQEAAELLREDPSDALQALGAVCACHLTKSPAWRTLSTATKAAWRNVIMLIAEEASHTATPTSSAR